MGNKAPKALNIYQNKGIKNTPGDITNPSIVGIGPPLKHTKRDKHGNPVKHSFDSHPPGSWEAEVAKHERTTWKKKKKEETTPPSKHVMKDKKHTYKHKHPKSKSGVKVYGVRSS